MTGAETVETMIHVWVMIISLIALLVGVLKGVAWVLDRIALQLDRVVDERKRGNDA